MHCSNGMRGIYIPGASTGVKIYVVCSQSTHVRTPFADECFAQLLVWDRACACTFACAVARLLFPRHFGLRRSGADHCVRQKAEAMANAWGAALAALHDDAPEQAPQTPNSDPRDPWAAALGRCYVDNAEADVACLQPVAGPAAAPAMRADHPEEQDADLVIAPPPRLVRKRPAAAGVLVNTVPAVARSSSSSSSVPSIPPGVLAARPDPSQDTFMHTWPLLPFFRQVSLIARPHALLNGWLLDPSGKSAGRVTTKASIDDALGIDTRVYED